MSEATDSEIRMQIYVEQVTDGLAYKGHIDLNGTKLFWTLDHAVAIPKLEQVAPNNPQQLKQVFRLRLFTDDEHRQAVELNDDEYFFFLRTLAGPVDEFYYHPQTRDSNQGMMGSVVRGDGLFGQVGIQGSIGMTSGCTVEPSPDLLVMLRQDKFGLSL